MLKLVRTRLGESVTARLYAVYDTAVRATELGIVEWVERAVEDASVLGKLRARDIETLERLERDFSSDFYRQYARSGTARCELAYA